MTRLAAVARMRALRFCEVSESFVRLSHLEHILLLLDGRPLVGRGIQEFQGKLMGHGHALARAGRVQNPADGERYLALGGHLHGNLVDGTGDTLGADFDERGDVEERLGEHFQRRILGARFDDLERVRKNPARDGLLPLLHETVDELFGEGIGSDGDVRLDGLGHNGFWEERLQDTDLLGTLGAVAGTTLLAVTNTLGVENAANDVVADARKILNAAAADEHHGVLLKVVSLTHDVRLHLVTVREAHAGDLAESGVGLLGRHGGHLNAHAALKGRAVRQGDIAHVERVPGLLERRRLGLATLIFPGLADELIDGRHSYGMVMIWKGQIKPGGHLPIPRLRIPRGHRNRNRCGLP